ncbi:unnamed protein product, partial [marine sediment metagenome]
FGLLQRLIGHEYRFKDKQRAHEYFTRLTGLFKNLNYAPPDSEDYHRLLGQISALEETAHQG